MGLPTAKRQSLLQLYFPLGQTYQVALLGSSSTVTLASGTFGPSNVAGSVISPSGTLPPVGTRVVFSSSGILPGGLSAGTVYYVVGALEVSLTSGGAPIVFTDGGTGSATAHSYTQLSPSTTVGGTSSEVETMAEVAASELTDLGVRPTVTAPAVGPDGQICFEVTIDNTANAASFTVDTFVLIGGGSTALGDTSGEVCAVFPGAGTVVGATKTVTQPLKMSLC